MTVISNFLVKTAKARIFLNDNRKPYKWLPFKVGLSPSEKIVLFISLEAL